MRDDIYVVPNFISEGYFTRTVIPRELELAGPVTRRDGRTIKYCEPVGNHPRMTELLLHRAAEIAPGVPPEKTSLFIVGHGTDLNDNSAVAAKREVERIRARGLYAEVLNAYMEEEPLISKWDEALHAAQCGRRAVLHRRWPAQLRGHPGAARHRAGADGGGEPARDLSPAIPTPARAHLVLRQRHRHGAAFRRCDSRSGGGFRSPPFPVAAF